MNIPVGGRFVIPDVVATHFHLNKGDIVKAVGSGDALLAILSVALFNKMDDELALFIASIAAAQSVETIGNSLPVNKQKLLKTISHALK